MKRITLPSHAKVNLYLNVLSKRPDGFHELVTLFERVGLADDVTLEILPGEGIEVACGDPEVPSDGTNLAARAAEAFRTAAGWPSGVRITIVKKIPVGGGLGGGSSNAATVLLGLQQLSPRKLPEEELLRLGASLGSDVGFFLLKTPWALGRGRGELLERVEIHASLWHLLVAPDFPIPTKAVYSAFVLTAPGPDVTLLSRALRESHVPRIRDFLFNALEPTVESLYPAIRKVKDLMERKAGLARPMVSGSGSTVMALCSDREEAERAAGILSQVQPRWRVFVASTGS